MRTAALLVATLAVAASVNAKVYFKETFDDSWSKHWIQSTHKSDYGKFKVRLCPLLAFFFLSVLLLLCWNEKRKSRAVHSPHPSPVEGTRLNQPYFFPFLFFFFFQLSHGKYFGDATADLGLQTSQDAHFYSISTKFDKPFSNEGEDLVLQFSVKNEQVLCRSFFFALFVFFLPDEVILTPFFALPPLCFRTLTAAVATLSSSPLRLT